MKKSVLIFLLAAAAVSCDNKQIKNTTDTIKSADSLFRNVKDSYKTLDSISQVFNDSTKVNKEISRQKEIIEKHVDLKNLNIKNLDSLTGALKKATENMENGTETAKTIDSAAKVIKNSDNPLETIGVIKETINKTIKKNKARNTPAPAAPQNSTTAPQSQIYEETVSKNAKLEMEVGNLSDARNKLSAILRSYNADIVSENILDSEGTKRQFFSTKIPAKYFDEALQKTETIGNITSKSIESSGTRYDPNQMYDLGITFREDASAGNSGIISTPQDSVSDKSLTTDEDKNVTFPKSLLWWLLLPAAFIGAFIWFLTSRNARKKREQELQKIIEQQRILTEKLKASQARTSENLPKNTLPIDSDEPEDYSRYMPK